MAPTAQLVPARPRPDSTLPRVALVTDTYAPATNGVVRSVETTRAALERLGATVRVFAPATASFARVSPLPGVRFFPAWETRVYPGLHVPVLPLLPRHLEGFDVVHVHTPGPLGLAALASALKRGIPSVYTYHTRFEDLLHYLAPFRSAERVLARLAERANRKLLASVDAVVSPTPAIADELATAHGAKSHVVPKGVDLAQFQPFGATLRRRSGDGPVLLHLGRLSREKNLDAVLRALPRVAARHPGARLLVAGAGPDAARSRALASELGVADRVRFLGFVPEHELPGVYRSADVFVTASEFETQGLTVLEAMACGTPVALADVPVFRSLGESVERFDAKDPRDVARGIERAWARRATLRARGLATAWATSTESCATRLLDVYRAALG